MDEPLRKKMFQDVFSPKSGEKILILVDIPTSDSPDSRPWKERRDMAVEWYNTLTEMGGSIGFSVEILKYNATGNHNVPIPPNIQKTASQSNLVIALTEFSATSSLLPICRAKKSITRCASMPRAEKRMEDAVFQADYKQIQLYAKSLKTILNDAIAAEILFSTGDHLFLDLRYRQADADEGECHRAGQFINFPSGEGFKVPYEAAYDEEQRFGQSKTNGILPIFYNNSILKCVVKNNKITTIKGNSDSVKEMENFLYKNETRRNIAELGIGCNPKAQVTGNHLEDEKAGLHIAYGSSIHIGGKIKSDIHIDLCYCKGLPVEGTTLRLLYSNGKHIDLIQDAYLLYTLL
jgi:leucyl aminopeptidase (aminopeptidase T)